MMRALSTASPALRCLGAAVTDERDPSNVHEEYETEGRRRKKGEEKEARLVGRGMEDEATCRPLCASG